MVPMVVALMLGAVLTLSVGKNNVSSTNNFSIESQTSYEPYFDVTMLQNKTEYSNLLDYKNWGIRNAVLAFMQQDASDPNGSPHAL
jgi:hypothetical protein